MAHINLYNTFSDCELHRLMTTVRPQKLQIFNVHSVYRYTYTSATDRKLIRI